MEELLFVHGFFAKFNPQAITWPSSFYVSKLLQIIKAESEFRIKNNLELSIVIII